MSDLDRLLSEIRRCRICIDRPDGAPLRHAPRPVVRASAGARLLIAGQAPGVRVHRSGLPFDDPSGVRLRRWLGLDTAEFYDEQRVAFAPMGFCFPGQDEKGRDLPPRAECAPHWRSRLLAELPKLKLIVLVGAHAQAWHLGAVAHGGVTGTVRRWMEILEMPGEVRHFPLPHPSWRNTAWLKSNPWFGAEAVPRLQHEVRVALGDQRCNKR